MKTKLVAFMLIAGGALFAQTHVSIGVQFGRPVPVVVPARIAVNAYRPPYPGPGYVWLDGYYDGYGNWYDGYWGRPPYVGAYWVAPRFTGGRFYSGFWGGSRGVFRAEPRFVRSVYGRGHERAYRPLTKQYQRGFRQHGRR